MAGESRLAVVESEIKRIQSDIARLQAQVDGLEEKSSLLRTSFEVLQTRVGMYAALGAVVGGGLVSLIVNAMGAYLHIP